MRYFSIFVPLVTAFVVTSVSAQRAQRPIMNDLGPAIPSNPQDPFTTAPEGGDNVILCDVLGRDRSINIFAGFTRDIDTIDKRLSDESLNTTVLAPLNSAIVALPRKPWENREEYSKFGADAYEGQPGEDRAHANLRRFVEEHVVPESPWEEGVKIATLAGGGEVWWETKDGKKIVSAFMQIESITVSLLFFSRYNQEILRSPA
jgi:hypothetical protein